MIIDGNTRTVTFNGVTRSFDDVPDDLWYSKPAKLSEDGELIRIPEDGIDKENCTITKNGKTFKLYGNFQIVESFPDIEIQIVESFADLEVKLVESFPDDCGKIRIVTSFPDVKVKIVNSLPDIKIKIVDNFPGF